MGKNAALMFHYASKESDGYRRTREGYRDPNRMGMDRDTNMNRYPYTPWMGNEGDPYHTRMGYDGDMSRSRMEYPKHSREYDREDRPNMRRRNESGRTMGYDRDLDGDDDDDYRKSGKRNKPHKPLDEGTAKEWVESMENPEDKSKSGEHWNMAQTTQVLKSMKLPYDPIEFYVVMNMMFTDYYGVAKKYGQEKNADFFVELSKGWLDDKDVAAGDKKTAMYYREIVV